MASPLLIHVGPLLRAPGSSRRVTAEATLAGLRVAQGGVDEDSVLRVNGRLDALSEGVFFAGTVAGAYRLECARCLDEVESPFDLAAQELFAAHFSAESEDGYPLANEQVDLEPLVRDVVMLGIPLHPLCRHDCAGICGRCGAELNEAACECVEEHGHPAFAALADLWQSRT